MKTLAYLFLLTSASVNSESLSMGNWDCENVIYHYKAKFIGIPFIKREEDIFFNSPRNEKIGRVVATDEIINSKATAIVTAGGIGLPYVNIKLTSERGSGLYYDIKIYS